MFKYKKAVWSQCPKYYYVHKQEDMISIASIVEQPYDSREERYFLEYRLTSPYREDWKYLYFPDLEAAKNALEAKRLEHLSKMLEQLT
jgi:hypothetical protein